MTQIKHTTYLLFCLLLFLTCQPVQVQKRFTIAFSQPTTKDAWRKAMLQEMERELTFHPDIRFIVTDAQNSNEFQIRQIDSLVQLDIDLLIVSPNESKPLTNSIEKVFEKNIPVIVIDREINSSQFTAYIGADNSEIGKIAGQYAANALDGTGNVLEIWGLSGSSPAIERHSGFTEVIDRYEGIKIMHSVDGGWRKNIAQAALQESDIDFSSIDLIYAHNDVMALAAHQFLREINYDKKIKILGVDGLPGPDGGIQMVVDGILDATFLYPTGGEEAIKTSLAILEGQFVAKNTRLETSVIDQSNARMMQLQGRKLLNQQADIERQSKLLFTQSEAMETQRFFTIVLSILSLLLFGLAGMVMYQLVSKQKVNKELEARNEEILSQRNELERLSEETNRANREKMEFFTNISHEFKTPLTLILAPTDELLQDRKLHPEARTQLSLVKKNAERMHRLVSQLMDFRKLDNERMKLQVIKTDIVQFVKDIMEAFDHMAIEKQIDFKFITHLKEKTIDLDQAFLDKVLFNLLSNAFKFTRQGGYIHISIGENEELNQVVINVADNGRGMSKEHVEHAFERFYQGENYSTKGTGLGLSLSKKLIELHQGSIELMSEKGVGTTFTIRLPQILLPNEQIIFLDRQIDHERYSDQYKSSLQTAKMEKKGTDQVAEDQEKRTILLIEDNLDLLNFLQEKLSKNYQVFIADTGEKGLALAQQEVPDLIICDLMLPGIQGEEVVRFIKEDMLTSHIPLIFLTAKSSDEQRMKGYALGIYDFISKPFQYDVLQSKIQSLFKNMEIWRKYYSSSLIYDVNKKKTDHKERAFFLNFDQYITDHFQNPDLQAEDICRHLGISKVQLYRKLKAIANITVNEYIQNIRLQHAKKLLTSTHLSMSEIAYQSGFGSPSYFSTAFKSAFGQSPSAWRKQIR